MRVLVYVEGRSDADAMQGLLAQLIARRMTDGVSIEFFPQASGDAKKSLVLTIPVRAARTILNDATAIVVAVPDLYPRNKGFPHSTFEQLRQGMLGTFRAELGRRGGAGDARAAGRFHVFCFKHDLEALVLAADGQLASYLGIPPIPVTWTISVEDQDHDRPPKHVVSDVFRASGKRYQETVDAPSILENADPQTIAARCPQCFKPFLDFLSTCGSAS